MGWRATPNLGRLREEAGMSNNPGDPYGWHQQDAANAHRVAQQAHVEEQARAGYAAQQAAAANTADGKGSPQYVAPGVSPAIKWLVVLVVVSVLAIFALMCAGLIYTAMFGNFR
jgi:hypothetical protein